MYDQRSRVAGKVTRNDRSDGSLRPAFTIVTLAWLKLWDGGMVCGQVDVLELSGACRMWSTARQSPYAVPARRTATTTTDAHFPIAVTAAAARPRRRRGWPLRR